jgi:hypothetical protein
MCVCILYGHTHAHTHTHTHTRRPANKNNAPDSKVDAEAEVSKLLVKEHLQLSTFQVSVCV